MRLIPAVFALLLVMPAIAQEDVPVPRARPDGAMAADRADDVAPSIAEDIETPPPVPLPRHRPVAEPAAPDKLEPVEDEDQVDGEVDEGGAEPASPAKRRIYQTACPALITGQVEATALPPIHEGANEQCGLQSPLAVTALMVNGRMVPLSGGATLSCGMATALPQWVSAVDGYAFARDNTRIASVIGGTSYMCRNVNNAATGNLSDHAFGDALDVVGFKLEDGRTVTVSGGWTGEETAGRSIVRYAHDAACSLFMTTLGPEANALHHDHLHVDLSCHGKSCLARLCE